LGVGAPTKVAGKWTYLYRAVDQHGQVIDALLSIWRELAAARRFFTRALGIGTVPAVPSALHTVEQTRTI
jgi:transposase-like protein